MGDTYWRPLLKVAKYVRSQGKDVEFIAFRSKHRERAWERRLRNHGATLASWDPYRQQRNEFLAFLATFDCLVTARYHGAVFASLLGIPVVCVGVDHKLEMVSADLGQGARLWRMPFRYDECIMALGDIENRYGDSVNAVKQAAVQQRRLGEDLLNEFSIYMSRLR